MTVTKQVEQIFINVSQASIRYCIPKSTIRQRIFEGEYPATKAGKIWLMKISEMDEILKTEAKVRGW